MAARYSANTLGINVVIYSDPKDYSSQHPCSHANEPYTVYVNNALIYKVDKYTARA